MHISPKVKNFITLCNIIDMYRVGYLFLMTIGTIYLFSSFILLNFFSLAGQLDFLKKIIWLPLYYLLFAVMFLLANKYGHQEKILKIQKDLNIFLSKFEIAILNKFPTFKFYYSTLVTFTSGYFLLSFVLFKFVKDIYEGDYIKT